MKYFYFCKKTFAMKKYTLMIGGLILAVLMVVLSCNHEDPEIDEGSTTETVIGNYFTIDHATLVQNPMPSPTVSEYFQMTMNDKIVPDGSSFVSLSSEVAAKKILVGMKNELGYYEVVPQSTRDFEYSFSIHFNQNIPSGFTIQVAIVDENDGISQIQETELKLLMVGTGTLLQVSLSFDNEKDLDLHLIEPEYIDEYGYWASFYSRHIYYGNRVSDNGGELDMNSNEHCWLDYINNENINYNDSTAWVAPGTYKVYVDLYQNCDPEIPTNYVVTVSYNGNVIASRAGVFQVDAPSTYNPIDEYYVDDNEPFLSFTIDDRGQKKVKSFEPAPLTSRAIEKEANAAHK